MISLPKILIIALVIAAVWFFFFRKKEVSHRSGREKKGLEEVMLECSKCGTFVASNEAIFKDGQTFCSKECAGLK